MHSPEPQPRINPPDDPLQEAREYWEDHVADCPTTFSDPDSIIAWFEDTDARDPEFAEWYARQQEYQP